jgi:diguanylate cyclase (GGDEF)-like protein
MLTGQQSVNEEYVTFATDQHNAFLETIKTPLRDAQGNLIGILGIARDISEHKKMQEKLQRQAITDELTGIYNRRQFMYFAEEEIQRMRRYGGVGSLLMLDLDRFKRINDVFGHPVGDAVLQSVTEICQQTLRCNDVFGRIGGEEFAILLMETDAEQAQQVAERLRKSVEEAVLFAQGDQAITVTVSIGVTQYNSPDDTLLQLLSRADNALYEAKNAGRNRVVVG